MIHRCAQRPHGKFWNNVTFSSQYCYAYVILTVLGLSLQITLHICNSTYLRVEPGGSSLPNISFAVPFSKPNLIEFLLRTTSLISRVSGGSLGLVNRAARLSGSLRSYYLGSNFESFKRNKHLGTWVARGEHQASPYPDNSRGSLIPPFLFWYISDLV